MGAMGYGFSGGEGGERWRERGGERIDGGTNVERKGEGERRGKSLDEKPVRRIREQSIRTPRQKHRRRKTGEGGKYGEKGFFGGGGGELSLSGKTIDVGKSLEFHPVRAR